MCVSCTKSWVQFPARGAREEEHIKVKHKIIKKTLIVQKKIGKKIK